MTPEISSCVSIVYVSLSRLAILGSSFSE
jgi:hypothetical protein